uniref:Uncharacterized protein n=1 Tax=Brassica oleracea TaxID=3712 RepID=A0A3P6FDJ8_BRAOL|nr:unnamed protein product [Brassica oleracea]
MMKPLDSVFYPFLSFLDLNGNNTMISMTREKIAFTI